MVGRDIKPEIISGEGVLTEGKMVLKCPHCGTEVKGTRDDGK